MKKNRILIYFGAVFLIFLILSSVSAINITQIQKTNEILEIKENEIDNKNYVDPNIILTKALVPKLKIAVKKIEDPDYRELTQKILEKLETKGIIKSNDLENILIELNIENTEIHTGKIIGEACCSSVIFGIPYLPFSDAWIGPAIFVTWNAGGDEIDLTIGALGHHITQDHNGFAFPFIGYWACRNVGGWPPTGSEFSVFGWSPFIIISYEN